MEEKLKENEPTPEMENVEGTPPPPTRRKTAVPQNTPIRQKNRVTHLLKEMWPAYLIEVVVIILGISITLALQAICI